MGGKIFRSGNLVLIKWFDICGFPIGPAGRLVFGKIGGHMRVARSSKKIPYGVYRSGIRAVSSLTGPLNPTLIIPQVTAFVKRQNAQKKWLGSFIPIILLARGFAEAIEVTARIILAILLPIVATARVRTTQMLSHSFQPPFHTYPWGQVQSGGHTYHKWLHQRGRPKN